MTSSKSSARTGFASRQQLNSERTRRSAARRRRAAGCGHPASEPPVARGAGSRSSHGRPERRPALIVVGATHDMTVMRLAMQAGARDLLPDSPGQGGRAAKRSQRVAQRTQRRPRHRAAATIAAFINAKGGCGATLLACNVAHMLAAESKKRDGAARSRSAVRRSAAIPGSVSEARHRARRWRISTGLDEVALEGYFTEHASGLECPEPCRG